MRLAWISVFDTVRDHPKTRRLAQELNVNRHEAIGILVCLWTWGLDNADRDGVILNATANDIADGVMYRRLSADNLVDCLIKSGWIDRMGDNLILHDWFEWQEKWFRYKDQRDADAARKRTARARKSQMDSPQDSPMDSPQDSPMDSLTEIQHSQPQPQSQSPNNNIDTPYSPPQEAGGMRGLKQKAKSSTDFDRFWSAYPKKVGKEAAKKAFGKVKVPVESLLPAIDRQKRSAQWSKDNGQYIPNPSTWLNQGRWEDELEVGHGMAEDYYHAGEGESL